MKIAIMGLSFSGKTTLFNALTSKAFSHESSGDHSSEAHIAVIPTADPRLDFLGKLLKPKKLVPAQVEYMDVAWIHKSAGSTAVAAHQINLAHTADAIAHVIRDFNDPLVPHPLGEIDPQRDLRSFDTELVLYDLEIIEKRIEKLESNLKKRKDKEDEIEHNLLIRCKETLNEEIPLRQLDFDVEATRRLKGFQFFTAKPQLIILNIDEGRLARREEIARLFQQQMPYKYRAKEVVAMAVKLEMELSQLPEEERKEFMLDLGLKELGLNRIIKMSLDLIGLITFFTTGPDEVRARTIPAGTTAVKAAGTVHTDMEKGFIRAEVISFEELQRCGTMAVAKEKGLVRLEGKDYSIKDGDIIHFRFHV